MLKITLHDSARELRLKLEGKISGPWVQELRQCWSTASSTTTGRSAILDLDDVDFIDPAGQDLLVEMHREGVVLKAATPFIRSLLAEICEARQCATVEGKSAAETDAVLPANPPRRHSRTL
jgi:anti-anti-sigma regulatory factor